MLIRNLFFSLSILSCSLAHAQRVDDASPGEPDANVTEGALELGVPSAYLIVPADAPERDVVPPAPRARDRRGHFVAELGGGLLGGGVAIATTTLAALATRPAERRRDAECGVDFGCLLGGPMVPVIMWGALVTSTTLVPAGVSIAGRLSGGRGRYWAAFLGNLVGAAGGTSVGRLIGLASGDKDFSVYSVLTIGGISQIVGAVVGYRLSAKGRHARAPSPVSDVQLTPSLAVGPQSMTISIGGTF